MYAIISTHNAEHRPMYVTRDITTMANEIHVTILVIVYIIWPCKAFNISSFFVLISPLLMCPDCVSFVDNIPPSYIKKKKRLRPSRQLYRI